MCRAITLAESTSTRPSLVLLPFERPEDFRKGFSFRVTEILLFILGVHRNEVHRVRRREIVNYSHAATFAAAGTRPPSLPHSVAAGNQRVALRIICYVPLHFVLPLFVQQPGRVTYRSEEHTSELQSLRH